jgi:hypothetical protein
MLTAKLKVEGSDSIPSTINVVVEPPNVRSLVRFHARPRAIPRVCYDLLVSGG